MTTGPRLLLVDDHPMVCQGLRMLLEPWCQVVGMVHHGNDVMAMVTRTRPDAILLDLSLPGKNGITITKELRAEGILPRILIVTMHAERVYVDEALNAGADGLILKTAAAPELRLAIGEILAGRRYVTPQLPRQGPPQVKLEETGEIGHPLARLTERQRQVLRLIGEGLSSAEIAERLELSLKAIEYHRATLRETLALTTQAALVRFAALYAAGGESAAKE
ncbi:MAG: response regulator transcription factor [Gemmatimonadota bacterium]